MHQPFPYVGFLILALALTSSLSFAETKSFSTGIGLDQREQDHPEYSLKLVFFVEGGAYLADIDVEISTTKQEKILNINSPGPWLFVDLIPGDYVVTATRKNGDQQSSSFSIRDSRQRTVSLMFSNP
jgi:hypothetical protein